MTDNGGPAFPVSKNVVYPQFNGMSLRDYFAGQALMGMIASSPIIDRTKANHAGWAQNAYKFADAMLAERDK